MSIEERKTISIKEETAKELNQYRLGGESWEMFFQALLPIIKKKRQ